MQRIQSNNIICFAATRAVVDIHYHTCFQIVISLDAPFNSMIDKKEYSNLRGFVVNQNITHSCRAENTGVLVYFIDAESWMGWQLKEMLDGRPFLAIDAILTDEDLTAACRQYGEASSVEDMRAIGNRLLEKVLPSTLGAEHRAIDTRIVQVIEYIEENLDNPLVLDDISHQIFLSPERIRHLFAQETGIPFSQYVLWKRIKLVLTQVLKDKVPIVNSAIQNGFTDQPHFARLFKRTFGISSKHLLKNSRFVQFLMPEL